MADKNEDLKLQSILQDKEAEAKSRGINWDNTDFGEGDDNTTATDTREMLTQALKSGDKNLAKFYETKLREETDAFGRQ
tara:strand:- start:886 stop:1122 length:237 start_codon:yes stop_codon:yes gene_type:complete